VRSAVSGNDDMEGTLSGEIGNGKVPGTLFRRPKKGPQILWDQSLCPGEDNTFRGNAHDLMTL